MVDESQETDVPTEQPEVAADEHDGGADGALDGGRALAGAAAAARGAGRHLAHGYAAVRDVRVAAKRHSSARSQARALRGELDDERARLERRIEIEGSYQQIIEQQTQALEAAQKESRASLERAEALDSERATLEAQLAALRVQHEEQLRPYRNLADTTKGRADDAAVALAEARRTMKAADARLGEAVHNRDQRVQSANRAVDSAQARLHKAQGELDRLQGDASASPVVVDRMRSEVAAEHSAVAAAKADVTRVSDEAQLAVDNAQTHLWTQRQSLEIAEQQAEAARTEARERREEYDSLYKQARGEESEMEEEIKDRSRSAEEARSAAAAADARASEAQALLDEARDVHDTPDVTDTLRRKVAEGQSELSRREEEVAELARREKGLRRRTRNLRATFFLAVVAVLVVVALVAWALLFSGGAA